MTPGESSGVSKCPNNRWTHDQRMFLRLLRDRCKLSWTDGTGIFNQMYKEPLLHCGIRSGLLSTALSAQYALRKRSDLAWTTTSQSAPTSEVAARRSQMLQSIRQIAELLGIQVSVPPSSFANRQAQPRVVTKRKGCVLDPALSDAEDDEYLPNQVHKRVRVTRHDPIVLIPRIGSQHLGTTVAARSLSTPQKSPKKVSTRKAEATIRYEIRPGAFLWVTPSEKAEIDRPLVHPPHALCHPPMAGLLYRLWDDSSQSPLIENGFVAGLFGAMPSIDPPSAPTAENAAWNSMATHMNRDQIKTPFISTSAHLVWIMRQAMNALRNGRVNSRITVIDSSVIDRRSIYHAQPFHNALKKKRCFTGGAFMYHGRFEFLIHGRIPKEAIVKTFPVQDLIDVSLMSPAVGELLRFSDLHQPGNGYESVIRKVLSNQNVDLSQRTLEGMAEVAKFLGATYKSPLAHMAHIVSDIIQGWAFKVYFHTPEEWCQKAKVFALNICATNAAIASFSDVQRAKHAFLEGVRFGLGDWNVRHKSERLRIMLVRAKKVGLESPAQILSGELDAARLDLWMVEKQQQRLFQESANQALLAEVDDEHDQIMSDAGDEEEADFATEREHIVYEWDEDEPQDDDRSVYES